MLFFTSCMCTEWGLNHKQSKSKTECKEKKSCGLWCQFTLRNTHIHSFSQSCISYCELETLFYISTFYGNMTATLVLKPKQHTFLLVGKSILLIMIFCLSLPPLMSAEGWVHSMHYIRFAGGFFLCCYFSCAVWYICSAVFIHLTQDYLGIILNVLK